MNPNKSLSLVSRSVSVVLLLLTFLRLPYGYFTFLRLVICAVAAFHCVLAFNLNRGVIAGGFSLIAILFNPIVPIYLSKETWGPIDLIVALFFLLSFVLLRRSKYPVNSRG